MTEYKTHDPRFAQQLENEGMSASDALIVAGAEMEGAPEKYGGIESRQTACPDLNYCENLKASKEALASDSAYRDEVQQWLDTLNSQGKKITYDEYEKLLPEELEDLLKGLF